MSLIAATKEIERLLDNLKRQAETQQRTYFAVITGMVALQQKHRVAGNYAVSDEIRAVLNVAGVEIVQGTDGYTFDKIPKSLAGRPVGDTWRISVQRND